MSEHSATKAIGTDIETIRSALRARVVVPDEDFDRLYPATHRYRSEMHWTPVDVALVVSEWLDSSGGNVLDVGSGVGKVCHIGAIASDSVWCGVERDPTMVRIARRIARELGLESRTRFVHGEALELDWSQFAGVYLFNPFTEAMFATTPPDPVLRQAAYIHEVLAVEGKLATLVPGTRVVTYHGFGGDMPAPFELVDWVEAHDAFVCQWILRDTHARGIDR